MERLRGILTGLRRVVSSGVGKTINMWVAIALLYFVLKIGERFVAFTTYNFFFGAKNTTEAATLFSMAVAVPWALKVFWAPLLDRFGSRFMWIAVSAVATILLTLALGVGDLGGLVLMGTIAVLQTLATATQDTVVDVIVIEQLEGKKRWPILAVTKLMNLFGSAIGGATAWSMVKGDPSAWVRTCLLIVLIMGVSAAVALTLLWLGKESFSGRADDPAKAEKLVDSFKLLYRQIVDDGAHKSFLALGVVCLFVAVCSGGTTPILGNWFNWLVDEKGVGFTTIGEKIDILDKVLKWVAVVLAGFTANRVGLKPVLVVAILLTSAGYASIGLTGNTWTETGLLVSVALTSLGDGAFVFTLWLAAMSFSDRYGYKATTFALLMTLMNVSELIWKYVGGKIAQADWLPGFLSNEVLSRELHQRGHEVFVKTGVDWNLGLFVVMGALLLLVLPVLYFVRLPKKEAKD